MQQTPVITPAQFLNMHGVTQDDNDCEFALMQLKLLEDVLASTSPGHCQTGIPHSERTRDR